MAHCAAQNFKISDRAKIATLIFVLSVSFFCAANPLAADETAAPAFNVHIVEGQAQISQIGLTTTITASTSNIIAQGNISTITGEIVNILLLSSTNNALLRSDTGAVTSAFGSYFSNGNLFMVNPAGFVFGPASQVNAASIVVSTLNINNADFLRGCETGKFTFVGQGAYIFNHGKLIPQPGGYVCLLSQAINNTGTIQARLGSIVLGAGENITLTTIALDDRATISVAIDEAVKTAIFGPDGAKIDSAIENSGTISANGGTVTLTAKTLNGVFNYAINNSGIIEAKSLIEKNGEVTLAAEGAPILNTGIIEAGKVTINAINTDFTNIGQVIADGSSVAMPNGGAISVDAYKILQQGVISANAFEGGAAGEIDLISEAETVLDENSVTAAMALGIVGSGGRIRINSRTGGTYINGGKIDVSGGSGAGDGGGVEISAFDQLGFYGVLSGRAPPGYNFADVILKTNLPYDPSLLDVTSLTCSGVITARNISIFSNQRVIVDGVLIAVDTILVDSHGANLSGIILAPQIICNMNTGDTFLSGIYVGSLSITDTGNVYIVGNLDVA
ncbi:MAG: hypothetical protein A3G36_06000 [Omnitrophica bacterium RIFCSPLOWO2_12_FULL_45_13]|nr:MAG: hypothetical protein A3G36_06000 [Omnitrophica bacterium RIFCSPLOWO2_12_FULL_45_13]